MKCPSCLSNVTESMKYCPSCGQDLMPHTSEPTPIATEKQSNYKKEQILGLLKFAAILLAIFLVFTFVKSLYANRGGCDFSSYGMGDYYQINYHGRLSKLVSKDYDVLEDFIYRQKVNGKRVRHLECTDYTLTYCRPGDLGAIDIIADNVTVYKPGLIAVDITSGIPYDRFIDDFCFCIIDTKSDQEYYFYSLSDVEEWIAKRT